MTLVINNKGAQRSSFNTGTQEKKKKSLRGDREVGVVSPKRNRQKPRRLRFLRGYTGDWGKWQRFERKRKSTSGSGRRRRSIRCLERGDGWGGGRKEKKLGGKAGISVRRKGKFNVLQFARQEVVNPNKMQIISTRSTQKKTSRCWGIMPKERGSEKVRADWLVGFASVPELLRGKKRTAGHLTGHNGR